MKIFILVALFSAVLSEPIKADKEDVVDIKHIDKDEDGYVVL